MATSTDQIGTITDKDGNEVTALQIILVTATVNEVSEEVAAFGTGAEAQEWGRDKQAELEDLYAGEDTDVDYMPMVVHL